MKLASAELQFKENLVAYLVFCKMLVCNVLGSEKLHAGDTFVNIPIIPFFTEVLKLSNIQISLHDSIISFTITVFLGNATANVKKKDSAKAIAALSHCVMYFKNNVGCD